MNKTIGIVGFGNMGSAIAERLKTGYQVLVFDKDKNKTKNLRGLEVIGNIKDLMRRAEVVILAVKPQDFDILLNEIKTALSDQLIVSIAAGLATAYIEKILYQAKVIRVMPNLPVKIGKGMTCLCKGKNANSSDLDFVTSLLNNLGNTLVIEEKMMDAATAVSGSGPGFLFDRGKSIKEIKDIAGNFATALTDAAIGLGFSHSVASTLSISTTNGSIEYLEKTELLPEKAKDQVASKGGTTEAGLEVLHRGGSLEEAVKAAKKRAEELSKKE